jgi:hypothetical protein
MGEALADPFQAAAASLSGRERAAAPGACGTVKIPLLCCQLSKIRLNFLPMQHQACIKALDRSHVPMTTGEEHRVHRKSCRPHARPGSHH